MRRQPTNGDTGLAAGDESGDASGNDIYGVGEAKYTAAGEKGPKVRAAPRHRWDSEEAQRLLSEDKPVILTDTEFATHARVAWTKDYLREHWDNGADIPCYVLHSTMKTAEGKPLFYYTDRVPEGQYNLGMFKHQPELVQANIASMTEFIRGTDEISSLEKRASENQLRMYLQTPMLTTHESSGHENEPPTKIVDQDKCYGDKIFRDLKGGFNWTGK